MKEAMQVQLNDLQEKYQQQYKVYLKTNPNKAKKFKVKDEQPHFFLQKQK